MGCQNFKNQVTDEASVVGTRWGDFVQELPSPESFFDDQLTPGTTNLDEGSKAWDLQPLLSEENENGHIGCSDYFPGRRQPD